MSDLFCEGVLLEDTGTMLRWGTPIEELAHLEVPSVDRVTRPDSVHLCWPNRKVLSGLTCDVMAVQIHESPNPRAYHIYLPELHWIRLCLVVEKAEHGANLERRFRDGYQHLERTIGPGDWSYPDYQEGLPAIHWELDYALVGYAPSSGRLHVTVKHEPAGYDDLRAEAKEICLREGEGRRVDYIAWPEA